LGSAVDSVAEVRAIVKDIAAVWVAWGGEYDSEIKLVDVLREVKVGPKAWGFEVWIHPGDVYSSVPLYLLFSDSKPRPFVKLFLPLRDAEQEILTYPEDNDLASDFLIGATNVNYNVEIADADWILEFLELPEDVMPYCVTATFAKSEASESVIKECIYDMPSAVQYVTSEIG
jgi:hypothetical protein